MDFRDQAPLVEKDGVCTIALQSAIKPEIPRVALIKERGGGQARGTVNVSAKKQREQVQEGSLRLRDREHGAGWFG